MRNRFGLDKLLNQNHFQKNEEVVSNRACRKIERKCPRTDHVSGEC